MIWWHFTRRKVNSAFCTLLQKVEEYVTQNLREIQAAAGQGAVKKKGSRSLCVIWKKKSFPIVMNCETVDVGARASLSLYISGQKCKCKGVNNIFKKLQRQTKHLCPFIEKKSSRTQRTPWGMLLIRKSQMFPLTDGPICMLLPICVSENEQKQIVRWPRTETKLNNVEDYFFCSLLKFSTNNTMPR